MALKVLKGSMSKLKSSGPAPPAICNRPELHAPRRPPQVQVRERRAGSEKRLREIPVLIPRVEVNLDAQGGIMKKRSGKFARVTALLRIPARQGREIYGLAAKVVIRGINGFIRQSAEERNNSFKF